MLIIKDIYEKELPGEMLFYVDDSVIFTNGKNGILNDDIFTDTIKNLNKNIKKQEKQLLDNTENSLKIKLPEGYSYSNNNFGVEVHNDDKSIYSEINIAKENSGERYLHGLCRETSNIGFDIYTAYSDEEIHMLNSRTHAILELVNTELARITQMQDATNEKSEKNKQYIKKLLRYKKFFAYRKTILEYKDNGTIKQLKKTIIEDITLRCTEKVEDLEYFFAKYTDDILAVLIEFVFKRCSEENVDVEDLIDAVNKLNDLLYSGNTNHSYLAKAYDKYLNKNIEYYENDTYKSIGRAMVARYRAVREQSQNNKYKRFQLDITSFCTNDYERLYEYLNFTRVFEYSYYVRSNSNELERMLLNSMFSYIFEYELDDRFNLSKRSRNPIEYSEIRILALLRNKNFDIKNFILQYDSYVSDEYRQTADYSLLQVLDVFRTFVSHPKRIDDLILIHKYCCDTWKNGSKYLHFYTLHNQEHAVSLIRSSIKVIHAISCFTLKRIDYFILFAACYLHDISMVTIPDISKFYMGNHEKADCIYTDFINEIDLNDIVKVKRRLCNAYQEIDEYFESEIRGKHAYESAREIRCHKELDFIEPSMREIIAQVSEGHGYDTTDIYFLKSTGKESLINKKIIMIILRLSDLLDMSRYRISNVVLNHNLKNLNDTSRFHWISHLITEGYELNNTHKINNQLEGKSFLQNKTITEKLVLTIDVLMCQTTEVTNKNKCKYVLNSELNSEKIDESEESEISISVICDKNSTCINDKCTFLCKWFMVKNNYLFKEFGELNHYLNNIQDNFYSSEIEIRIKVISNNNLPNDIFDYLREYIDQ